MAHGFPHLMTPHAMNLSQNTTHYNLMFETIFQRFTLTVDYDYNVHILGAGLIAFSRQTLHVYYNNCIVSQVIPCCDCIDCWEESTYMSALDH